MDSIHVFPTLIFFDKKLIKLLNQINETYDQTYLNRSISLWIGTQ